jgi:hypothetical protein
MVVLCIRVSCCHGAPSVQRLSNKKKVQNKFTWSFSDRWVNQGEIESFIERVKAGKIRGELAEGKAAL